MTTKSIIIKVQFFKPGEDNPEREFHYNMSNSKNAAKARRSICWALNNGFIVVSGNKDAMERDEG